MATTAQWLAGRAAPVRGRIALAVGLGEAAGILLVLQTALLASVVNAALFPSRAGPFGMATALAAALAVIAMRAAATWGARRAGAAAAAAVKVSLRGEVMAALRRRGPVALAGERAGEAAHAAVDAVDALDAYFARYLPQRAIATLLPFTFLAVVFPLDWVAGLILVLTAVFLPASMVVVGEDAHERNRRLWGALSRMSGRFLDVLQGLSTVRMFDAAGREARAIAEASEEHRRLTLSVLRVAFVSSLLLELISAVSIAIVAVVSGLRLLHGTMAFFPAYFVLLAAPEYFLTLRQLGTFYHSRMEAVSAAETVRAILEAAPPGGTPGGAPPPAGTPAIALRGVSVSFKGRKVLDRVDLAVAAGERVTLAGESGEGKSTLLAVLLGFVRPEEGTVEIDGSPLDALDPDAWRARVGWLPQRPTMFHGTVRSNVALGSPGATDEEVARALLRARAGELVDAPPRGLETPVGEGGSGISGGQAQRVALARLFLRSPSLVLLDEPTAHLDAETAGLVARAADELCEGRTAIVVTHRPEAAGPGRTLFLRNGRVEEAR